MAINLDALIEEVETRPGCSVIRHIEKTVDALEFIRRATELAAGGKKKISPARVTAALQEHWNIVVSHQRVADHLGGRCSCPKTK